MQKKTRSGWLVGLLSGGALIAAAMTSSPAQAQTTSVGPYYAMPSWSQTLPAATRFIILSNFSSEAVLDRNTGLVWERSPATTLTSWSGATFGCINKNVGGQKGWRLPSIPELASLIDPSVAPGPTLPAGHHFTNVQPDNYWSATTLADDPTLAWRVNFNVGNVSSSFDKPNGLRVWCVRGGMNADAY